jgi:hypothetical protein
MGAANHETSEAKGATVRNGQRKQQSQKRSEEAEERKAEATADAQELLTGKRLRPRELAVSRTRL